MPFADAEVSQLLAIFLIGFLFLLAMRTVSSANDTEDDEPFVETRFECRDCGEELDELQQPCPVCGGEIERNETPAE